MRICLLIDDGLEDFDPVVYLKNYEWEAVCPRQPIPEFVKNLIERSAFDVYLNLFEGDEIEPDGESLVREMEARNLAFTGTDSAFYSPTREQMQSVAEAHNIRFARGFRATQEKDLEKAAFLQYPLIVKHPNSYASAGLIKESRVESASELREQFMRILNLYGSARVEEFVDGRECSCLVVDNPDNLDRPFVYQPAEIMFPNGETFLYEDLKWLSWDLFVVPVENVVLSENIQEISKRFYLAMKGCGYARLDLRIRPNGEVVVIEINPNPGVLFTSEDHRSHTDLPISWDADGHNGFLERIFRSALLRQKMRINK